MDRKSTYDEVDDAIFVLQLNRQAPSDVSKFLSCDATQFDARANDARDWSGSLSHAPIDESLKVLPEHSRDVDDSQWKILNGKTFDFLISISRRHRVRLSQFYILFDSFRLTANNVIDPTRSRYIIIKFKNG